RCGSTRRASGCAPVASPSVTDDASPRHTRGALGSSRRLLSGACSGSTGFEASPVSPVALVLRAIALLTGVSLPVQHPGRLTRTAGRTRATSVSRGYAHEGLRAGMMAGISAHHWTQAMWHAEDGGHGNVHSEAKEEGNEPRRVRRAARHHQ